MSLKQDIEAVTRLRAEIERLTLDRNAAEKNEKLAADLCVRLLDIARAFAETSPWDFDDSECMHCPAQIRHDDPNPEHAETCPWARARKEVGL